jgi:phytoene dehydrogenase-like protein
MTKHVTIIGSGISGLSTAALLTKDNIPVQIFEKSNGVGDSTISYGIGTDSAAHSSILCHPKIISYLKNSNPVKLERVIQG